jgi:transposase
MAQRSPVVGIDVSKQYWDVARYPDELTARFTTDEVGQRELLHWLSTHAAGCMVACEPSGGLERNLVGLLSKAGIAVRLVDARRVRRFAEAIGRLAKNDRLDAKVIAHFAATVPGPPVLPDAARQRLAEWMVARDQLQAQLVAIANQASRLRDPTLQRLAGQQRQALNHWLARLEAGIATIIAATPALARAATLIRSVPGVGPLTAARLLAELPELGQIPARQAAALVGVVPYDRDSGTRRRRRAIVGGRTRVRCGLYMAALVAAKHNPTLHQFHDRLRQRGKLPKVALTAVIHKLVRILTAILRDGVPWQNQAIA